MSRQYDPESSQASVLALRELFRSELVADRLELLAALEERLARPRGWCPECGKLVPLEALVGPSRCADCTDDAMAADWELADPAAVPAARRLADGFVASERAQQ